MLVRATKMMCMLYHHSFITFLACIDPLKAKIGATCTNNANAVSARRNPAMFVFLSPKICFLLRKKKSRRDGLPFRGIKFPVFCSPGEPFCKEQVWNSGIAEACDIWHHILVAWASHFRISWTAVAIMHHGSILVFHGRLVP
jgi:hypothetical protein